VNVPLSVYAVTRVVGVRLRSYFAELAPPVAAAAVSALAAHVFLSLTGPAHGVPDFVLGVLVWGAAYVGSVLVLKTVAGYDILGTLRGSDD
jgi:hypothetical protein